MTKDNPVAAGVAECVARRKAIYELKRDAYSAFAEDEFTQFEVYAHTVEAFEYLEADLRALAASPVQAGIDPLVAEIEAGLEGLPTSAWRTETAWPADYAGYVVCGFFGETPHMPRLPQARAFVVTDDDFDDDLIEAMARHVARCSPDNIAKLIAGYRSQAERIAALEVERDALAMRRADEVLCFATAVLHGDDEHREWLLAAARAFIDYEPLPPPNGKGRAEAAESLLAEAREALEQCIAYISSPVRMSRDEDETARRASIVQGARATLSRLKPGEKGGEE